MNKTKKIISGVIFIAALIILILPIGRNFSKFTEKFDPKSYEKKYNNSQYVIPQSKSPISDEELLSYAGYKYATGLSPILINADHPPLGKYMIGWTTLLFGNNRIVSLLFAVANITLAMVIIYSLTGSLILASLGFLMISLNTVFLDQIIYSPVLDIIQVFFLLCYFYIFMIWQKTKKNIFIILLGITLGILSSVKIYFPSIILSIISFPFLWITKDKNFKKTVPFFFLIITLAFLTYTASYFGYFLHGNSFRNFLGTQKWIFLFWKNNSIQVSKYYGSVLPLILFNQWKVWWGNKQYINFAHWSIFWPIFFIAGIFSICSLIIKGVRLLVPKNTLQFFGFFLSTWSISFLAYLCFIPISPRYLMMLYFPLYILIILFIKTKFNKYV